VYTCLHLLQFCGGTVVGLQVLILFFKKINKRNYISVSAGVLFCTLALKK
jgi:hypothetical protein